MHPYKVYILRIGFSNLLKSIIKVFCATWRSLEFLAASPANSLGRLIWVTIQLVDNFPIAKASSDQRACEFDFSLFKTKSGAPD